MYSLLMALAVLSSPSGAQEPAKEQGIVEQTRGPIHEAYAQPVDKDPAPTNTVPKAPPPPVPELPPNEKPPGENMRWIPGYWAWDPEKKDYLWVSGVWRAMPPDRKWVPGYWHQTDDGWDWVPGFWGEPQGDPRYLPAPPDSVEEGPSQPAPGENFFYIPGCWVYQDGRYVWRPGFWYPAQSGWSYQAPHYNYTPRGAVYVDGYWDYPFEDRGTLYAPVTFSQPWWNDPGWYYQPCYPLGWGGGGPWGSMFVGLGWGHYYCGDYFAPYWGRFGYRPWYNYCARNYDPLFAYHGWANRNNPGWYNNLHNGYWNSVRNPTLRPPGTLAQTNALAGRGGVQTGAVARGGNGTPTNGTRLNMGTPLHLGAAAQLQGAAQTRARSEASGANTLAKPRESASSANSATRSFANSAATNSQGPASASSLARASSANATPLSSRNIVNRQANYPSPSAQAPYPRYLAQPRNDEGGQVLNFSQSGARSNLNGMGGPSAARTITGSNPGAAGRSYVPQVSNASRGPGAYGGGAAAGHVSSAYGGGHVSGAPSGGRAYGGPSGGRVSGGSGGGRSSGGGGGGHGGGHK